MTLRLSVLQLISLFAVVVFFNSCEDSSIVGAGLLEQEELEIFYTEDVELVAKTIRLDSLKAYSYLGLAPEASLIGRLDDPFFGVSKSSIYTQLHLIRTESAPDYESAILDSLIMVLAYDSSAMHGNNEEGIDLSIHRVTESMANDSELYTDKAFAYDAEPIAVVDNFIPNFDSLLVFRPDQDSSVLRVPALRIPLETRGGLGTELFNNIESTTDDEVLEALINGFYITTQNVENRLIGLNLFSNNSSNNIESKLELYYRDSAGENMQFDYGIPGVFYEDQAPRNATRYTAVENDRTNSVAEQFVNDEALGDSLLFLSGQLGYDIEIDLADAMKYNNFALNKAELELTVANLEGDNFELFPPIENLHITRKDEDGDLTEIDDLQLGIINGDIEGFFGGDIQTVTIEGETFFRYTLSITSHVQQIMNGSEDSKINVSIRLSDFGNYLLSERNTNPRRSIIYGPGHSKHPAKLKLTYTAP